MIEFLSILFGLYTGVHAVELSLVGDIAEVEIRLDGEMLLVLSEPPWSFECDFGPDPAPHELIAIARDAERHELDRAIQWVNLEQATSGAAMSFETDNNGRPVAVRISWESIGIRRPQTVEVLFDDKPLAASDLDRIPLPRFDPGELHFVSATVRFSDQQVSRLEASFGGNLGEEIRTELTAVAVTLEKGTKMPPAAKLQDWFVKDGQPLAVHGIEKGPPEVIFVRDPTVQPYLHHLGDLALATGEASGAATNLDTFNAGRKRMLNPGSRGREDRLAPLRYFAWLGDDTYLRFMAPGAAPLLGEGLTSQTFLHSPRYGAAEGGFLRISQQLPEMVFPMRFADAVATAGMTAHGTHRRRAVVLMLGEISEDRSRDSVDAARRYLRQLHVPLVVWTFAAEAAQPGWGQARYVGPAPRARKVPSRFKDAVGDLRRVLQEQRIVWIEGRHLPQTIELSPAAHGIRLAGH